MKAKPEPLSVITGLVPGGTADLSSLPLQQTGLTFVRSQKSEICVFLDDVMSVEFEVMRLYFSFIDSLINLTLSAAL